MPTFSGAIKQTIAKFNIASAAATAGTVLATCPDNATMDVEIQGIWLGAGSVFTRYLEIQTFDQVNNVWRGSAGAASASAYGLSQVWPKGIITDKEGGSGIISSSFVSGGFFSDGDRKSFSRYSPQNDRFKNGGVSTDLPAFGSPIRLYPNERLVVVTGGGDIAANFIGITTTNQSNF